MIADDKPASSLVRGKLVATIPALAWFWDGIKEIAAYEKISVAALVTRIDTDREYANLSSAIRLYVLDHYRRLAEQALAAGKGKP
jgi:predicted DNA-binding ribbon-helix-helix protein